MFRTEEAPYSILNRVVEYDLLPACQRLGVGVFAFGVLAGGWLSGRYRTGAEVATSGPRSHSASMDATNPANATKLTAAHALGALADDSGLTLVQLATAWAAVHPAVSSVIIGPRTMAQLEGYLAAENTQLSTDVLDQVDTIVAPGVTLDPTDTMWVHGTRALDATRRRR
jgi:aryl-alcohol dehydrogenase-like predicted oxidoreductase